ASSSTASYRKNAKASKARRFIFRLPEGPSSEAGLRILYGVQATGNGHISRARMLLSALKNHPDIAQLDVLLSGHSADASLDYPVRYRCSGIGFSFGKTGGIDFRDSFSKAKPARFMMDVKQVPAKEYDLVLSDFEPVSAWAGRLSGVKTLGISHQAAFFSPLVPRPAVRSFWGERVMRHYAPADHAIGFHYKSYDSNVLTPLIRDEVRQLVCTRGRHITVYLPSYDSARLIPHFLRLNREVHLFCKHTEKAFDTDKIRVRPVSHEAYLESLAGCAALVCGAGFQATSEALHLGKRLFCIPMRHQYEQACNAAALLQMGVPVANTVDEFVMMQLHTLLQHPAPEPMNYPDIITRLPEKIVQIARRSEKQLL
ncbi:MAG: glycosyltransferase family protein, partial [Cyclonatronaceae bacterium]